MKNGMVKLLAAAGAIGAISGGGLTLRSMRLHANAVKAPETPLQLDAATEAIFAQPDRVEALRLADFHENWKRPENEFDAILEHKYGSAQNYTLIRPVRLVNTNFAPRLRDALRLTPDPKTTRVMIAGCFDPGVGFRVWRGKARAEMFVCFHCQGVEIVTTDERKKEPDNFHTDIGAARKSLLALSREAFPEDATLRDLKDAL